MPDYRDPFGDDLPGPYLTLRVSWNGRYRDVLALLDTGCDSTQIPQTVADALELEHIDDVGVTSSHGDRRERPLYIADLEFEGFQYATSEVVGDEYPIALIGRDLLNQMNAMFEGPAGRFELTRP